MNSYWFLENRQSFGNQKPYWYTHRRKDLYISTPNKCTLIRLQRFSSQGWTPLRGTEWSLKYLVKCCTGQKDNCTEHYTDEYKYFQTQLRKCTLYISFKLDWLSAASGSSPSWKKLTEGQHAAEAEGQTLPRKGRTTKNYIHTGSEDL